METERRRKRKKEKATELSITYRILDVGMRAHKWTNCRKRASMCLLPILRIELNARLHNWLSPFELEYRIVEPLPPSFENEFLENFYYGKKRGRMIVDKIRLKTRQFDGFCTMVYINY